MKIDLKYLTSEICKYREIMGDRRCTIEQCGTALQGLLFVYVKTEFQTDKEKERAKIMMQAVTVEHDIRLKYRLILNI